MIDFFIIASLLGATFLVGLYTGKKIHSIEDYAVGGRQYGSFVLFATLSASFIGGGFTFGIAEKTYSWGMIYAFCLLGFSLQQILIATCVAPHMSPFSKALSAGDIMGQLYGRWGKNITGVASVLVCTGIIGAQVNAIGYIFNLFLGIDQLYGVLIGCGIVIAYSVTGGMKAVVATDLIQFFILAVMFPVTLYFGIEAVGGVDVFIKSIPEDRLSFSTPHLSALGVLSLFLSLFLGETLVPPYVQRLLITQNRLQTQRGVLWSGILSVPFFLIAGCIGLVALVLTNDIEATMALPYVIQTALPVGFKGLAISAIIAVVMSSADSFLNAAGIAVVHDLIKPNKAQPLSSKQEVALTRLSTLVIGIGAIIFALKIESVLDVLLYSYNFWSPIILVPLIAGMRGYRVSVGQFLFISVMSIITVLSWSFLLEEQSKFDGLVIGVFVNFILFIILYNLESRRQSFKRQEVI